MLLLAILFFATVQGTTLCDGARSQWSQLGSSAQSGVLIDNPDLTAPQNADAQRRFRILRATIARCNTPDGSRPAYRRPYNGRRTVIHTRNGRRQYAVRRANGQFEDIQNIGRASRLDQRRQHLVTADRPSAPVQAGDELN